MYISVIQVGHEPPGFLSLRGGDVPLHPFVPRNNALLLVRTFVASVLQEHCLLAR